MDTNADALRIAPDAAATLPKVERAIVPVDETANSLEWTRRVAGGLAVMYDFELVLYDRSKERWADTPHAKGPIGVDELRDSDRTHLVEQLDMLRHGGVEATAWLATVPALAEIVDALQELDVDAVIVPEKFDNPTAADRADIGEGPAEIVARMAALNMSDPPSVFMVTDKGDVMTIGIEESN